MSTVEGVLLGFVSFALLAWTFAVVMIARTQRALRSLRDAPTTRTDDAWPRVSVIIPALNEADTIERALRSKLAVDYPNLEVVIVDDRSTDETGVIADRVAREDPRVRVVHVTALPDGWLGKVHALHQGALAATGALLVFSDADVHFEATALRRAVRALEDGGYGFLTVLPQFERVGLLVDACVVAFARLVASGLRLWEAEDPNARHAVGVGAFSMVTREALFASQGFEWLRCEVADDVALAMVVKRSGARCGVRDGRGFVSLIFYPSTIDMVRAIEKQGFAILGRFSLVRTVLVSTLPLPLEWSVVVALWPEVPALVRAVAIAAVCMQIVVSAIAARFSGLSIGASLLTPIATTILSFAMVRSGVLGFVKGGVRWRGTLYRTETLRAGQRVFFP